MIALPPVAAPAWPAWPDYALVDDLVPAIRAFANDGPVALATLVSVAGSAPRPPGSEMVIAADGRVAGYVSGGCVEAAVALEAQAVLADGVPRLLDYGRGSPVIDLQLSCGGRIGVFVRELHHAVLYAETLDATRERRRTVTMLTDRVDGTWRCRPGVHHDCERYYARVHSPAIRLVVVGGDPAALALARLAPTLGIEVVLLRPNGPLLPPTGTTLAGYDPRPLDLALADLALDERTAVYALSHDADTDHLVLATALASAAFAVGALGSRTKSAPRLARLRDAGMQERDLQRVHLPAGLPLGIQTPHGIAFSILAEVCQAIGTGFVRSIQGCAVGP
jgi:xanthine dehydrogenase accessory factor